MHGSDNGAGPDGFTDTATARHEPAAAVTLLSTTRDAAGVERLADEITRSGAERWTGTVRGDLIEALVLCLTGDSIRQDTDAEDAICSALAQMNVMRRTGNLAFEFIPDDEIAESDLAAIRRYRGWLPAKYTTRPRAGDDRGRSSGGDAVVYGVTVQTLNRSEGNGITMLFVEATDPLTAEARARRIAQRRYECEVLVDHPVPCPGFAPTPDCEEPDRRS